MYSLFTLSILIEKFVTFYLNFGTVYFISLNILILNLCVVYSSIYSLYEIIIMFIILCVLIVLYMYNDYNCNYNKNNNNKYESCWYCNIFNDLYSLMVDSNSINNDLINIDFSKYLFNFPPQIKDRSKENKLIQHTFHRFQRYQQCDSF